MASPDRYAKDDDQDDEGGVLGWPRSVVRWLFGRDPSRHAAEVPGSALARFRNVCISREAGAGAGSIARLVGTRLSWRGFRHPKLPTIPPRVGGPTGGGRPLRPPSPRRGS